MNWLDMVIIVSLVVPVLIGLKIGLIRIVLPLIGVILGIYLAGSFYGPLSSTLFSWLDSPNQARIAAFVLILVFTVGAIALLSWLINRTLQLIFLGWVDKLGGAVFGLALGALLPSVLLAAITKFELSGIEGTVQNSSVAAFFLDRFPLVLTLLPEEFDSVRQFFG